MKRTFKYGLILFVFLLVLYFLRGLFYPIFLNFIYKETVPQIRVEAVTERPYVLLDCREKNEFNVSQIQDAKWIGFEDFDLSRIEGVSKDTSILLYCSIGYRSERIGEQLIEMGYGDVQHLRGGIFAWKNQGEAVYKDKELTKEVHPFSRLWGVWLRKGEKVYSN